MNQSRIGPRSRESGAWAVRVFALAISCGFLANSTIAQTTQTTQSAEVESAEHFILKSELLTDFWGREFFIEAGVVMPPDRREGEKLPVCYNIHGFGGSHRVAWRRGPRLIEKQTNGDYPRMIYVYLNAQFSLGHHEFADSVNNGPWGAALTTEFIPALEEKFGAAGTPGGRFLTGHSSGGWSSLWLQITYPDFFGGTWSTAPDPVDFRHFIGVDIYEWKNAYVNGDGAEHLFIRRQGELIGSVREFSQGEVRQREYGGQMASFDAVFSPRGEDGRPMRLYDRETGEIDPFVAKAWEQYDISLILRRNWETLGPKLKGKIRIYCGTQDTYSLDGAFMLLRDELDKLGSDAEFILVEGRDHGTLLAPEANLWPAGLLEKIHREMVER